LLILSVIVVEPLDPLKDNEASSSKGSLNIIPGGVTLSSFSIDIVVSPGPLIFQATDEFKVRIMVSWGSTVESDVVITVKLALD
jgi:hypothetical protein